MKILSKSLVVGFAALVMGGAVLHADPADEDPTAGLSVELAAKAKDLVDQVHGDLRHVMHLQQFARKQRDVIKLTCVNDKLVQAKAQGNIFDNAVRDLGVTATNSALTEATGAAEGVRKLREEAEGCVGEPELASESTNGFTGPHFPDDPTIGDPFNPGLEPPAYASPFN